MTHYFRNLQTIRNIEENLSKLSKEQLLELATRAIYHLRAVSGSRNSFNPDFINIIHRNAYVSELLKDIPIRTLEVAEMHDEAANFVSESSKYIDPKYSTGDD